MDQSVILSCAVARLWHTDDIAADIWTITTAYWSPDGIGCPPTYGGPLRVLET
jgi:hypothetical protein